MTRVTSSGWMRQIQLCLGLLAALASCLPSCVAMSPGALPQGGEPAPGRPGAWTGDLIVQTIYGDAQGRTDRGGSLSWKGLPYAAPPVGGLRWRAPREPARWNGARDAGSFANVAPQLLPLLQGVVIGSEDCLYLNVWRPAGKATKLPVYVFIHGGGNTTGSANQVSDYEGWAMASRAGVVFVSMNYRLGPLGWFLDPALAADTDPLSASGNFGTLDIIAALRWIRQNIVAFGGDPGNVTISGESAGASNVLSLLISPAATGLFHRAVAESGGTELFSRETALEKSAELFTSLLIKQGRARDLSSARSVVAAMSLKERATTLRAAPAQELIQLLSEGSFMGMTGGTKLIADGVVLPVTGYSGFATGDYANKVPLMIGSNKEEQKLFLFLANSPDWKDPLYAAIAKFGSLYWKAGGVDIPADAIASAPGAPPVYVYRFDWGAPDAKGRSPLPGDFGTRVGAGHTIEISFFLGTGTCLGPLLTYLLFTKANSPGREELSAGMMTYLASFAATGDPNAGRASLPPWPRRPLHAADAAAQGQPVGIIFDATEESASFAPLLQVSTREGVSAAIDAELSPELAARARARLKVK